MELRVSLDEREDPDEEQEIEVEGIPFVVNEDVIDSYGLKYTIAVDEHNMPAVSSELQKASPAPESDGACSEEKACSLSLAPTTVSSEEPCPPPGDAETDPPSPSSFGG